MLVNNVYSGAWRQVFTYSLCWHPAFQSRGIIHSRCFPGIGLAGGAKTLVGRKQKTVCHCPGRRPCAWPPLSWKCSKYQQTFSKYQQTLLRNFSWYYDHWYFDNWYFVTAQGAVLALDHHRHRHGDRIPGSLTLLDTIFFHSSWLTICLKTVMLYLLVL